VDLHEYAEYYTLASDMPSFSNASGQASYVCGMNNHVREHNFGGAWLHWLDQDEIWRRRPSSARLYMPSLT
jgi:hypothetical protein